jgi:hypothetical protein
LTRVTGSGWIGVRGFGSGQRTDQVWEAPERLADHVAFPPAGKDSRHYGRFDLPTRLVCHAVHLALQNAGYGRDRAYPDGSGLVGTGDVGTLAANLAFYRDPLPPARPALLPRDGPRWGPRRGGLRR